MTLIFPGVSDGSYALCKHKFELAEKLLEDPDQHLTELADILNQLDNNPKGVEFLKMELKGKYDLVYQRLKKNQSCCLELTLDEFPADNGAKKTQSQWIDSWNQVTDGRVMASMGDLYQNFKLLKRMSEQGTEKDKVLAKRYLAGLRQDFDWPDHSNWLVAGTRLTYQADSLEGVITQHNGSNKPELIKETRLLIPVYRDSAINQVVNSSEGLKYLQTLHDTDDDPETIMQTLEFICGKNRNNIGIWTADTNGSYSRKNYPDRAAGFYYGLDYFLVGGLNLIVGQGRSRGVKK